MLLTGLALAAPPAREARVEAAVQVVRDYYAAISRHDYRAAHALWSGGRSLARFAQGYAQTASVHVTAIPPFVAEGAAGSVYADIRVIVRATLIDGTRHTFAGSYTLRRVNDVEGATARQRRWHIVSARLKAVPAGA